MSRIPTDFDPDDGAPPPMAREHRLPDGHRLHEYLIDGVAGEGGFSIVYRARDTRLQRSVALKEYIPATLAQRRPDGQVVPRSARVRDTYELGLRSFVNEAQLLASFDHPALIRVYRFWEENGTAYMVMPYVQAPTLKAWLTAHPGEADETWLRRLLAPLLDALEMMHASHCYHRDIAPDNILLVDTRPDLPRPLLLDLGAARRVIGDATQQLTVIVKPGYAPIEQYAQTGSARQGPWTDLYALCAVMYAVVTGRAPVASASRVFEDTLVPARVAGAGGRWSASLLAAIDAGLALRPEHRPASVAVLRAWLDGTAAPPATDTLNAAPPTAQPVGVPLVRASAPASASASASPAAAAEPAPGLSTGSTGAPGGPGAGLRPGVLAGPRTGGDSPVEPTWQAAPSAPPIQPLRPRLRSGELQPGEGEEPRLYGAYDAHSGPGTPSGRPAASPPTPTWPPIAAPAGVPAAAPAGAAPSAPPSTPRTARGLPPPGTAVPWSAPERSPGTDAAASQPAGWQPSRRVWGVAMAVAVLAAAGGAWQRAAREDGPGAAGTAGSSPASAAAQEAAATGMAPGAATDAPVFAATRPAPMASAAASAPVLAATASAPGEARGVLASPPAVMRDVLRSADASQLVSVTPEKPALLIGQDRLRVRVQSAEAGYLYLYQASPDGRLTLLFPNRVDQDHHLEAGQSLTLPKSGWNLVADGPPGYVHLLALVSPVRRELGGLPWRTGRALPDVELRQVEQFWRGARDNPLLGRADCEIGTPECPARWGAGLATIEELALPSRR